MKLITRFLTLIAALATIQCGGSSTPMAPSSTISVTLSSSSIVAGATAQGTVTLTTPAATAMTVALSSSNTSVATVPATVAVQAGASTTTFTLTGVAAGSATIVASANGATAQSAVTVTAGTAALAGLSLADATVTEGANSSGTVMLTSAAPQGGAAVTLTSDAALIAPMSAIVSAGATSATFSFSVRAGTGATSASITASYGGASKSATVSIGKPSSATARFGVTGPTETETCEMASSGTSLNCIFNASTSSAPGTIVSYEWTISSKGSISQTMSSAVLTNPTVDCSLIPAPPLPAGTNWFPLTVTLKIRDDRGNEAVATDQGARVLPMHACGF